MNTFTRAIKYISRKKLRSIILFIVFVALSVSILACLTIRNSASASARQIKETFGASFTIEVNPNKTTYMETVMKDGSTRMKPITQSFTPDMVRSFLEIGGVTNYRSNFKSIGAYFDLEVIPGFYNYLLKDQEEDSEYEKRDYHVRGHDLQIFCVLNSETQEYFDSGAFELIEGRHITLDDNDENHLVVLISDKFAIMNGLNVGDTIVGENRANMLLLGDPDERLGEPHAFEIAGIYKINFSDDPSIYTSESEIAENFLFSGYVTDKVIRSVNAQAQGAYYEPSIHGISKLTLFVESPEILNTVIQDVTAADIVDWDYFNIYEDDAVYQDRVKPLQSMIMLTTGLLLVFILGVLLILGLLITLWTKTRKHEISIYVSIGLKKASILRQLIVEIMLLALIAFALAIGMAMPLTNVIGNKVADSVVQSKTEEQYVPIRKDNDYFRVEKTSSDPVELEYAVMMKEIAIGGAVLLAVSVGSAILSAGSILRLKPKELLQ